MPRQNHCRPILVDGAEAIPKAEQDSMKYDNGFSVASLLTFALDLGVCFNPISMFGNVNKIRGFAKTGVLRLFQVLPNTINLSSWKNLVQSAPKCPNLDANT
jgi:hypothetical protein